MCGDHKKVRNHCLLCAHAIAKTAKVKSVKLKAAKNERYTEVLTITITNTIQVAPVDTHSLISFLSSVNFCPLK